MHCLSLSMSSDDLSWLAPILYFNIFWDTYFVMDQVLNSEIYCFEEKPLNFESYLYSKGNQIMGQSELIGYKYKMALVFL